METERIRAGSAERGARWRSPRPMWRGGWAVLAPAHRGGSVSPAGGCIHFVSCLSRCGGVSRNVLMKTRGAVWGYS